MEVRFHVCLTADLTGRSWSPLVFWEHQEAVWSSLHSWTAHCLIKPSITKNLSCTCVWQKSYVLFEIWNFSGSMFHKFQVSSQSSYLIFNQWCCISSKKKKELGSSVASPLQSIELMYDKHIQNWDQCLGNPSKLPLKAKQLYSSQIICALSLTTADFSPASLFIVLPTFSPSKIQATVLSLRELVICNCSLSTG